MEPKEYKNLRGAFDIATLESEKWPTDQRMQWLEFADKILNDGTLTPDQQEDIRQIVAASCRRCPEWVVFSTSTGDRAILVQDVRTGDVGWVKDHTLEEWSAAFYAPSKPYRWHDNSRVEWLHAWPEGKEPYVYKAGFQEEVK